MHKLVTSVLMSVCLVCTMGSANLACAGNVAATSLPAAQPAPGSIVVHPGDIQYYTKAGDTLGSIARTLTTKPENWANLAHLNHISQDANIAIGTPITIPAEMLADEASEGTIAALAGPVQIVQANGTSSPAQIGAKLLEGAQIETGNGGFVSMSLPDGSRLSLPSNSQLKLSKLRMTRFTKSPRTELLLLHGHVESRVAPLNVNQGQFEVRTPVSVAGVRGTHFRVGYDAGKATTEVLSGNVAVSQIKQKDEVSLPGGKGNVTDAIKVGAATDLLPAPTFESAQVVSDKGLSEVALGTVPGAASYHVQIARDPDALNVIAEARTASLPVKIQVPQGEYFVLLSAVDKVGLEGKVSLTPASFKQQAPGILNKLQLGSAPYIDSADDKNLNLHWSKRDGQRFRVQVARDAEFTWLVFTTEATGTETRLPRPAFGTYYARIQPINGDGSMSPFSAVQSFIVTDHWVLNDGGTAPVRQITINASH